MRAVALSELDRCVRHGIYAARVASGLRRPPREQAAVLGAPVEEVRAARRRLADAHALVIDVDAEIVITHPLSAAPTGFEVAAAGRAFNGNCIWDSLAIPAMLDDDASIAASCGDYQEPTAAESECYQDPRGAGHRAEPIPVAATGFGPSPAQRSASSSR